MKRRAAGILKPTPRRRRLTLLLGLIVGGGFLTAPFLTATVPRLVSVKGTVELVNSRIKTPGGRVDASGVVVWLQAVDGGARNGGRTHRTLAQRGKRFIPHVLPVEVGSEVDFPNEDPFFHNVFSIYEGRRFDLGLYASGETRPVTFNRPGISYIFCNIHPQMSAIVIALETPYVASTDQAGAFVFNGVPEGRYRMEVWHERATPEHLATLSRVLQVGPADVDLGSLRISEEGYIPQPHRNKHGEEYDSRGNRPAYRKP